MNSKTPRAARTPMIAKPPLGAPAKNRSAAIAELVAKLQVVLQLRQTRNGVVVCVNEGVAVPVAKPAFLELAMTIAKEANRDDLRAAARKLTKLDTLPETSLEPPKAKDPREPTQADLLIQLAKPKCVFMHDDQEETYATIVDGKRDTVRINSKPFQTWLSREFYVTYGRSVGGQARADAVNTLAGIALHDGPLATPRVRIAEHAHAVYIDLANQAREIVRVDRTGWRVTTESPVPFLREKGMGPLPVPSRGGSLRDLRHLVNTSSEDDFVLLATWIVAALNARGPYPILTMTGEQGTAKSTTTRLVRKLVDPNAVLIRSRPKELRDIAISARRGHVLAFDNLSEIGNDLSDMLCTMSTGGGFATRTLHSNDEETIFDFQRPVVCNGIDELATRADLAERCLSLRLAPIAPERRRTEGDVWRDFDSIAPRVFGALLDGLAGALANRDSVKLARLPRMAEFAVLGIASEKALGFQDGAFMRAYERNQREALASAIEADVLGTAVLRMVEKRREWRGSPGELLAALSPFAGPEVTSSKAWPKFNKLKGRLERLKTPLRNAGVEYEDHRTSLGRAMSLRRLEHFAEEPSQPSLSTAHGKNGASGVTTRPGESSSVPSSGLRLGGSDDTDDGRRRPTDTTKPAENCAE